MASKNENRNQHYVPKCYLRNFSDGDKFIATFLHSRDRFIKEAGLDSVAFKEYLYGKDLVIENILKKLEGDWAETFKAIIANKDVSNDEMEKIIFQIMSFIAFQNARTLRIYDTQVELKNFLTTFIYDHSKTPDDAKKTLNRYYPNGCNLMEAPINTTLSTIETFKDLQLLVIENNSETEFITSDNPVVLYNKFLTNRDYRGNYGLASKGLCILVPLTPKICICLFDPKIYFSTNNSMICSVTKETAHELNKIFCRNSYEMTFFTKRHSEEYAYELRNYFVDKLESTTRMVDSNVGPIILHAGASILEKYELPFITIRKSTKSLNVPILGPAPHRYIRKTTY